jgi:hypothetical protein
MMNERIRELANQANDLANRELEQLEAADGRARDLTEYKKRYTEYLVDLVVRECMEQVWYTREDGINGNVSEVIKDRIKEHFGVEL